ncbi:hypothetical protein RvY_04919 [Ramazzottius varieornatus]|uniref:Uncharacterized protein n=1 Tax=Ramazzottius varieornatus TaxID=947166 RepID=A0A1D1UWF4_RAMVA|nr:hypothetical protein RvY_04919 [Ramazzottius varieornatus]
MDDMSNGDYVPNKITSGKPEYRWNCRLWIHSGCFIPVRFTSSWFNEDRVIIEQNHRVRKLFRKGIQSRDIFDTPRHLPP